MKVVTSAMMTIMENSAGEITPISRPMLRMTSSIRPRVFISVPSPAASRRGIPLSHDAKRRAAKLACSRYQDDKPAVHPHLRALHQSDVGTQAGECEEQRQQKSDRDGLKPVEHVPDEMVLFRHDGAHQECAKQKVDTQILRQQR